MDFLYEKDGQADSFSFSLGCCLIRAEAEGGASLCF
jgi:hypothetical protein